MTPTAQSNAAAHAQALDSYLRVLAGHAPGARLLEIRFALRHRDMGRLFIAAHSAAGAGRLIRRLAPRTDVYIGVCLRGRRSGGRNAIDRSHLAFVEIDTPDAVDRLRAFRHPPTMVVSSGSAGHAHAYFALSAPVSVPELERANRRLAHALGGDLACVDGARILRPPSSWNHKHTPAAPVELIELDRARRYELEQLVDGLDELPGRPRPGPATGRRTGRTEIDRRLLAIPAAEYVRALSGVSPDRTGKIHCPFTKTAHRASTSTTTAPGTASARAIRVGPFSILRRACGGWKRRIVTSSSCARGWPTNSASRLTNSCRPPRYGHRRW